MLADVDKALMFDDLVETNRQLNAAYDAQVEVIADMAKAIWQAKQALDAANSALLAFVDRPDEDLEQTKRGKKRWA